MCALPTPSQLQPKSSNLKSPQLNPNPLIHNLQTLLIILQNVSLPNLLNLQARLNGAPSLTTQALVDAKDDASALTLGELTTRDILVVFTALDGVEDEGGGALKGYGGEEGGGCGG